MILIDRLIEAINKKNNPSVVGLDTSFDYLPEDMKNGVDSLDKVAEKIVEFNKKIVDATYEYIPAVKVQIAYYEMYGIAGLKAFKETCDYAKQAGLIVINDIKRNDIGATASCYSKAYLSGVEVNGKRYNDFYSDFVTINGYLGTDGIKPFVDDCKAYDKGLFILAKTSNPSSGEMQDKVFEDGNTLYETMGDNIAKWGSDLIGKYGYSSVGAVVGATHKAQAEKLRERLKSVFFLIPGYGAQGGTAEDLSVCFDKNGNGGIVNSSRGILCAYKKDAYKNLSFDKASKQAVIDMRDDIVSAINK